MQQIETTDKIAVALEQVASGGHSSFHTGVYRKPYFNGGWHYHPEYELLLITKGSGKRLVGDHGEAFGANDLVLLGSYLPHAWIPDAKYLHENSGTYCESIYIQFRKSIFGSHFVDVPELKGVRRVLRDAERGLKITGKHREEIIAQLKDFPNKTPIDRLLQLIKILDLINLSGYKTLVSEDFLQERFFFRSRRILKVHEHIMENYQQDIAIGDCAAMVNMTVSSFCRYFKRETQHTFTNYLNRVRIDFAKKLLANTDLPIKEIGFECGYNSVPYFNKQFKMLEGVAPFAYRKSVSRSNFIQR